jgi:hypothetical protein
MLKGIAALSMFLKTSSNNPIRCFLLHKELYPIRIATDLHGKRRRCDISSVSLRSVLPHQALINIQIRQHERVKGGPFCLRGDELVGLLYHQRRLRIFSPVPDQW